MAGTVLRRFDRQVAVTDGVGTTYSNRGAAAQRTAVPPSWAGFYLSCGRFAIHFFYRTNFNVKLITRQIPE